MNTNPVKRIARCDELQMEVNPGEVHDGNKLRLQADANDVKKLFYVAPGALPGRIRLNISGTDSLKFNDKRELVLTIPLGSIAFKKPVAWQEIDGKTVPVTQCINFSLPVIITMNIPSPSVRMTRPAG